jgi:hypothetical protein
MEYHWTTKLRQKTLVFFFQSVSRVNTANMIASPLLLIIVTWNMKCSLSGDMPHKYFVIRGNSVTVYDLAAWVPFSTEAGTFLFAAMSRPALVASMPLCNGYRVLLFRGWSRPDHEANNIVPRSRPIHSFASTPQYPFAPSCLGMGQLLLEHENWCAIFRNPEVHHIKMRVLLIFACTHLPNVMAYLISK